ncbi:MAG TPA: hypothetical protein VHL77_05975 [Ferruginibacter sp.]|jgi:hypothetical protein|nr:hypothetical protein [Ferruginibacter sp.]
MTRSFKRTIIYIVAAVVLGTVIMVYLQWNKPHKNVKDAEAIAVAAHDLYNSFVTDSAKARSLYTDKVVAVNGEVAKLSLNQQQQQVILLKTAVEGAYINCTMENGASGIKPGDQASIKGICSGYISGDADMGLPGDVFLIRGYTLTNK